MFQWIVVVFTVLFALIVACRHIARGLKGQCSCSPDDCSGCSALEIAESSEKCRCEGNNET
ncbi:hypothetical protein [Thermodesulforhabdus norvegica]|uniref:FeoB-associated Cys-rich membrane protein n=1 Tax=Thermodesulforhabdus norvegica TaxID=39841 RepID=A0A1I4R036_9BACT|nr:hypothetical protein [Thermodesulforhabdus norvegica]SFM45601.1 hypothetical protein SAMN05660836_00320 [Thermodesulforhabdus norvegica]